MKKLLSLTVCLLMLLTALSCTTDTDTTGTSDLSHAPNTDDAATDNGYPAVEDDSYKDVSHVSYSGYGYRYIGFKDDPCVLSLLMPMEWETVERDGGHAILRGGADIGYITKDKSALRHYGDCVYEKETDIGNRSTRSRILREIKGDEKQFYYNVTYKYTADDGYERSFYIEVDYTHAGKLVQEKLSVSSEVKDKATYAGVGMLKTDKKSPRILILGNSFISSSSVGELLRVMSQNYNIKAVSIGFATVYRDEHTYLEHIKDGNYDYVFLCGYYSSDAVEPTGRIYDACKAKGAQLVIFPAHNENTNAINDTVRKYPDIPVLNWKAEVDALIRSGVQRSDMCINDSHSHSTELAGYVGAHMIYRAIYDKMPTKTDFGPYLNAEIQKLGDYISTGSVCLVKESAIMYLD